LNQAALQVGADKKPGIVRDAGLGIETPEN
jgi:hypothetical protein